MFQRPPVSRSADFDRVRGLPVRGDGDYPPDLAAKLTAALKTPKGAETLREVQAKALYDVARYGKGFFPLRVGAGKTLVSFLIPRVIKCDRPALLVPANLLHKTDREHQRAQANWQVAKHMRWFSYQKLGRDTGAQALATYNPDLLIADECHFLKNPNAAVTRRVARFMSTNPQCRFIPMSGTIMKDSILDFAHLMAWAMGDSAPIPAFKATLQEWADALDEGANPMARRSPGVLLDLFPGAYDDDGVLEDDNAARARRVYRRRTNATAGIVSSDSQDDYTGSLYVEGVEYPVNAATEQNFENLREEMLRPDGWALTESMQVWAIARQLALGLHYAWEPPAPQDWLDARKAWARFVRDTLRDPWSEQAQIDSEFQVMNAVRQGRLHDPYGVLEDWIKVKPSFTPNPVPVWHDRTALERAAAWLGKHKGICWVEHVFFAQNLSKLTGCPYYGAEGLDAKGRFIEDDPGGPIIASIAANCTGRNLQKKWSENFVTAPPMDSERWEQLIGRTHRAGQVADGVSVEVMVGCREHLWSIPRALRSSDVKADLLGFTQKIRVADVEWPDHNYERPGFRWAKTEGAKKDASED